MEVEISLFLKESDIDILTLNETWLKSKFKLDIPNYIITRNDRPRMQGGGVAILVRSNIKFDSISSTRAPHLTLIMKPLLFFYKIHNFQQAYPLFIFCQLLLLILPY